MQAIEVEVKQLIIESLQLEDLTPEDVDADAALFGDGLGLDSIDALELSVALAKRYSVLLDGKTTDYKKHFASVRNLALFVSACQQRNKTRKS